ncbi:MAG TPA: RNA polymerase sigma factor [Bacteroidia bacterium]|nr:RNA polymerase sigma factor [Bacteroidia bacterium]HNT80943.1 RNA polymerase sigma factor [Bacteroidia bacterium]
MNTEEYNTCVKMHADNVYRFILHNMRDEEEAKDIVQDSFEKMWINVANINAEKSKSYLFTTAYRTMIDRIRRKKRMVSFEIEIHDKALGQNQYTGGSEVIQNALSKLPEIQRSVILLRDYEGYSYDEIGEITQLNTSQVKVYIYRARTTLKQMLVSVDNII